MPVPGSRSRCDVASSYRVIHLCQSSFARGATMLVASTVSMPCVCANAHAPEETNVLWYVMGSESATTRVHLQRDRGRRSRRRAYRGGMRPSLSGTRPCARTALASLIGFLTPVASSQHHIALHRSRPIKNGDTMARILIVDGCVSRETSASDQRDLRGTEKEKDAPETAPTLPKSPVRPSIMAASHSTVPWNVRLEP